MTLPVHNVIVATGMSKASLEAWDLFFEGWIKELAKDNPKKETLNTWTDMHVGHHDENAERIDPKAPKAPNAILASRYKSGKQANGSKRRRVW